MSTPPGPSVDSATPLGRAISTESTRQLQHDALEAQRGERRKQLNDLRTALDAVQHYRADPSVKTARFISGWAQEFLKATQRLKANGLMRWMEEAPSDDDWVKAVKATYREAGRGDAASVERTLRLVTDQSSMLFRLAIGTVTEEVCCAFQNPTATPQTHKPRRENCPYRIEDDGPHKSHLVIRTSLGPQMVKLTGSEARSLKPLIDSYGRAVVLAGLVDSDSRVPRTYANHLSRLKKKIRKSKLPDYIKTPGGPGEGSEYQLLATPL